MFSGIVTNIGTVSKLVRNKKNCLIEIFSNLKFKNKDIGSSISCSGVCLTIEKVKKNYIRFYVSTETIKKTIFKKIKIGDSINIEKSLKFGDRISGHFVQGHVDTTSKISKIKYSGKSWVISFKIGSKYKKYIIEKGSITVNGVSLTIAKISKDGFQISVIPHTLKLTNLTQLRINDIVNIEFDVLGKYIKNFMN
jgi:riboflavin synthase